MTPIATVPLFAPIATVPMTTLVGMMHYPPLVPLTAEGLPYPKFVGCRNSHTKIGEGCTDFQ